MQHEAAIRNYGFEECLIVIKYFMSTACHKKFVYIAKSICSLCLYIHICVCNCFIFNLTEILFSLITCVKMPSLK